MKIRGHGRPWGEEEQMRVTFKGIQRGGRGALERDRSFTGGGSRVPKVAERPKRVGIEERLWVFPKPMVTLGTAG